LREKEDFEIMTEKVMNTNAVSSYLMRILQSNKVRVREADRVITIVPVEEAAAEKKYSCPFLGIAADSSLTVDKFLEWKREEREAEHEKELRS
jgi:hypothetical protein